MATVSIILPVYNAESTVTRAIHSILQQSFQDLELLVINDGSTDQTFAAISKIRDPRLKPVSIEHVGVAAASNTGLELSTGEFVGRMDADDVAHPDKLARQLELLKQDAADCVGCQVRILDLNQQPVESMRRYADWINRETIDVTSLMALRFVELPLVNPTILARRSYFELGYRDNDFPEDYDLFLRGAAAGFRFAKIDQVLFDWYDLTARLTRTHPRYRSESFQRCREHHLLSGPLSGISQVDLWGAGQAGKPWYQWLIQQGITVRHWLDISPRKIGQQIYRHEIQSIEELPPATDVPLIIAVGREGARDLIHPFIEARGYVAGDSAWFVS